MFERLKFHLICTSAVAISWILFFKLNTTLFSEWQLTDQITWVFLPSGLRLLATLLLRHNAIIGLFIGAAIMGSHLEMSAVHLICISIISAITPYLAYICIKFNRVLPESFKGMTAKQLVMVSAVFALFSASVHNVYFHLFLDGYEKFWMSTLQMFIGDVIGSILMLYLFSLSIKLIRRFTA